MKLRRLISLLLIITTLCSILSGTTMADESEISLNELPVSDNKIPVKKEYGQPKKTQYELENFTISGAKVVSYTHETLEAEDTETKNESGNTVEKGIEEYHITLAPGVGPGTPIKANFNWADDTPVATTFVSCYASIEGNATSINMVHNNTGEPKNEVATSLSSLGDETILNAYVYAYKAENTANRLAHTKYRLIFTVQPFTDGPSGTITDLEIASYPKQTYYVGDYFNTSGLRLVAIMEDGSRSDAFGQCDYDIKRPLERTDTIVKISYGGKSVELPITVQGTNELENAECLDDSGAFIYKPFLLDSSQRVMYAADKEIGIGKIIAPYGATEVKVRLTLASEESQVYLNDSTVPLEKDANGLTCDVTLPSIAMDISDVASYKGATSVITLKKDGEPDKSYTFVCYSSRVGDMPDKVLDFLCIGSQFTNSGNVGNPFVGINAIVTLSGAYNSATGVALERPPYSLGNFGGYITYYYEDPIIDDPKNPYGIDFIVHGNPFSTTGGAAEPGQVYVSQDGQNWFALAGSVHYEDAVDWDYSLTYINNHNNTTTVRMPDGTTSTVKYQYPLEARYPLFNWDALADKDSITLSGVHIGSAEGENEYGNTVPISVKFGYADTGLFSDSNQATNPYSGEIGYDVFDLQWAVDAQGQPVDVSKLQVHYVKIQTATFIINGSIGEKSTEINMMRRAAADNTAVGKTQAPSAITIDGKSLSLQDGKNVYNASVYGGFMVKVDAPAESNIYINGTRGNAVGFDKMPKHGMLRIIVQEGQKEPYICYVNLDNSAEPQATVNLTLDANGGTINGSTTQTLQLDEGMIDYPFEKPVFRGHTFYGWEYEGKIYDSYDGSLPNGATLTAKWDENSENPVDPDMITVYFRLIGSTKSEGRINNLKEDGYRGAEYVDLLGTTVVEVPEGAVVLDVMEKALEGTGITYINKGNYISSVTSAQGLIMAEETNGPRSGWMYTIGGKHSSLGISEQPVSAESSIIFHYVNDYYYEVADWDEFNGDPTYPGKTDSTYHNAWLKAVDTGNPPSSNPNIPAAPDKTNLKLAINDAKKLNASDYTPESWATVEKALRAAQETDADPNATQSQIDAARNALTAAMNALQRAKLADFREALRETLEYIAKTVPAPAFGTTSGEWSVLALARDDYSVVAGYYEDYYDRIVETVKSTATAPKLHEYKSTDNSRLILALTAIGRDPRNVGGYNLIEPLKDLNWVSDQGLNGSIFALIALDSGNYPDPGDNTRQELIKKILTAQLPGGGFPLDPGGSVDLDITGMALQALAPYYKKNQPEVVTAVEKALAYLSSVQDANGSFGSNSEVNVQAIVALSALGIDAKQDKRFIKANGDPITALLNYAVDGGGFKHLMSQTRPNAMACDQAAYALVAYTRLLDNKNSLYNMTDVTPAALGEVEIPVAPSVSEDGKTAVAEVDDTKVTEAVAAAKQDPSKGTILITAEGRNTPAVEVILNSISAHAIAAAEKALRVTTDNGGLHIGSKALKAIADHAENIGVKDKISMTVERKANEDVKSMVTSALSQIADSLGSVSETAKQASVVEVTIRVNGSPITSFNGESLTVDLPVSSALYKAGETYRVMVISGSNNERIEESSGVCRNEDGRRIVRIRTTHLSTFVVVPVLADTPEDPDEIERPITGQGIEVYFTLLGDSVHGETDTPHTLAGDNLDTWVSQTKYKLAEDSTVWDLLKKVLREYDMTWSNPSGNYVESITRNGKTLGEFTNGRNSGWMYTLNGTHPSLGVSEQILHDGDRVIWHYTDDYTKEKDVEKWGTPASGLLEGLEAAILQPVVTADKKGVALAELAYYEVENMIAAASENKWKELIIQPKVEGTASKIGIVLSKEITSMITDKSDLSLSLHTKYGNASLTNAGLTELSKTMKESLTMSVEKTETGTVKVDVLVDGKRVNTIKDGLRVTIPVEENGNVIAIIENGTEKIIRKSIVDGRNLLAVMDGSCELKVLDNSKSFGDLEGHWAKDAVAFASSHELFNGTGPERFEPDTVMSRAMLATVLYRLEDAAAEGSNPFADVASGTWYTDAVIWASGNGIVNGTGSGFAPDRDVTRQELVAMLYRYANSIGMDTGNTGSLDKFTDRNSVAEWAKDAMSWAVANGLVNGRTATTLAPEGTATRAEVAAILQRLVTKMVNA